MADPLLPAWEALAAWYDAKQGESGDLWHRALIDPPLIARIGEVRGRQLLDLGCGNGYLARRFGRAGARVTGVDGSRGIVARARARERADPLGIDYLEADGARMPFFADARFDLVYANMSLMDIADAGGALREVGRVLRPGGRLVASLDHPCFGGDAGASWVDGPGGAPARRVHRYRGTFDDPGAWNLPEGRTATTPGYHRPLAVYAGWLRDARLAVTALDEPEPTPEFFRESPRAAAIAAVPLHLVLEARKLPGPPDPRPGDGPERVRLRLSGFEPE